MCYDTFSPIVIQEKNMFNDGNVQCVFISKIRSLHFIFPFTKSVLCIFIVKFRLSSENGYSFLSLGFQTFSLNIRTQKQISIAVRSVKNAFY